MLRLTNKSQKKTDGGPTFFKSDLQPKKTDMQQLAESIYEACTLQKSTTLE
jgi:hypothetical protein